MCLPVRAHLARLLVLCFLVMGGSSATVPAAEVYGNWSTVDKANEGFAFMMRVRREFISRALRLEREGGARVDITMPFVDGIQSNDPKTMAEWQQFADGKMSETATARWISQGLVEMEKVRKKLAGAEKSAAAAWDQKHKDGRKEADLPAEAEAFLYDMQVNARHLGVILDNSRSMTKVLPLVRNEISRRFPGARFLEVNASSLKMPNPRWGLYGEWYYTTLLEERNPFEAKWFLPAIPQEEIHYHMTGWKRDTFAAMRSLVTLMEVDAIYWFCDFEDAIEPAAVRALGELLTQNKVKLYVHSEKKTPPGAIMNLVRETRGKATKALPVPPAGPAPQLKPFDASARQQKARLITKELLQANVNSTLRVAGTVTGQYMDRKDRDILVKITAFEASLEIRFPEKSFKPERTTLTTLAAMFPQARRFEAVGQVQLIPADGEHGIAARLVFQLQELADFKLLPPGTPLPPAEVAEEKATEKEAGEGPHLITAAFLRENANKGPVTVTGIVGSLFISDVKGSLKVSISTPDTSLSIRFPEKAFQPGTPKARVRELYPEGRTFVVTGKLTLRGDPTPTEGATEIPLLRLESLQDLKILPEDPAKVQRPAENNSRR